MTMHPRFHDRAEAGRQLADKLTPYRGTSNLLVLALPRGGVPVGGEVARALHVPLDVFVVRKLGVPGQEELAMGAIASGGVQVLNDRVVRALEIDGATIAAVALREQRELERRERLYRGDRPPAAVAGRTVIVVDDGIATGATMRAALGALRKQRAGRVVVASPVMAWDSFHDLRKSADDVVAVLVPENFFGVGEWYVSFAQTTDAEVRELLRAAEAAPRGT